mmetsp:Transcript_3153/g.12523  ORF Transcript_3153/g.12523 Transcript_3153/m.12523 type:complete len:203 (+) Transcript_3153:582-1190(+)
MRAPRAVRQLRGLPRRRHHRGQVPAAAAGELVRPRVLLPQLPDVRRGRRRGHRRVGAESFRHQRAGQQLAPPALSPRAGDFRALPQLLPRQGGPPGHVPEARPRARRAPETSEPRGRRGRRGGEVPPPGPGHRGVAGVRRRERIRRGEGERVEGWGQPEAAAAAVPERDAAAEVVHGLSLNLKVKQVSLLWSRRRLSVMSAR